MMATHKDYRGIASPFGVLFAGAMLSPAQIQNVVVCDKIWIPVKH
jgi:hypothetical protein